MSRTLEVPISRLLARLARWPKTLTAGFSLGLAGLVGWLDYATGYELHVTAFYLIPLCWVSCRMGRRAGLLMALAVTGLSLGADIMSGQAFSHPGIAYWNAVMLLAVFVVAVYAMTAALRAYRHLSEAQVLLKNANEGLEETVQRRTAALRAEIAERRRLEEEKRQAEQLLERREKLAVLGTLTAGIAHEIRNPLTSLKARLYTLDKHLQHLPAARKDSDIISAEIARLERIVRDALSFARPADPKWETLSANRLLQDVQALMAANVDRSGVRLVVEPGPELLLRADSGHLMQVLINLVRNAAEAISGTGTVTLRARAGRATLGAGEAEAVILEVSDTGKGIPPDVEKRLFDPFFSTKDTGTGLGLPIAVRMVEKHGGRIEYETQPGHGTTFRVVLPRETQGTTPRGEGGPGHAASPSAAGT